MLLSMKTQQADIRGNTLYLLVNLKLRKIKITETGLKYRCFKIRYGLCRQP